MNINRFNINYIIINKDIFDVDNIICNINQKTITKSFISLEYKLNDLKLDGLYFEAPKISLFNNNMISNSLINKYNIDIPLIDNVEHHHFNNIFINIDKKFNEIIKNEASKLSYNNSVKNDVIIIKNNKYEYKYIKCKLNTNECNIYYDNKLYTDDIEKLDFNKLYIKCIISCYGFWKHDNNIGLSWKILKLYIYSTKDYCATKTIDFMYNDNLFKIIPKYENTYHKKKICLEEIKIPNFELETD